ncbi:MAG: hypothetical protein RL021_1816 [Bacteroidota bacterium]|jgi:hypothetical protein
MKKSLQQLLRLTAVTEAIRNSLQDYEQSRKASAGSNKTGSVPCLSAGLTGKRLSRLLTEMAWAKQSVRIDDVRQSLPEQLREVLLTPFRVILFTFKASGFSFRNFIFTCVIPIVPFAAAYCTLIRQMNRHSEEELLEIIRHIHVPGCTYRLAGSVLQAEHHDNYSQEIKSGRKAA